MRKRVHIRPGMVVIYLLLLAIGFVCLVPLLWMVRSSLMSNTEIFMYPPQVLPKVFRFDNYVKAYEAFPVLMYLKNTLTILVPSVIGTVLTSSMAGYAFARIDFPGRRIWFTLVIGAMILPGHVLLIPQYLTFAKLDLVNTYGPLIIPSFLGGGAANIFLMRQFFRTLPKEYDEAAIIDGCGHYSVFLRILLPLMTPILITVSIFTFMGCWNDFFGPLIYLQRDSKFTLALGLLTFRGIYASKWNYLMAASTVMTLPVILLFIIGQKYFLQGITFSGIKG